MANENENGAAPAAQPQIEVAQSLIDLNSMLEGLPGSQKIMQDVGKEGLKEGLIKNIPQQDNPDKTVVTQPKTVIPKMDNEEEITDPAGKTTTVIKDPELVQPDIAEPTTEGEEDEDEPIDNPLLKSIKGKGKKEEFDFKTMDQVRARAKKEFGIELRDDKDFGKVFSAAKKWREDAVKVPDLEKTVEQYEEIFTNMPTPLLNGVKAYFDGKADWDKEITSKPKFDFKKPADEQSKKALVNYYYPGKFKDEDFQEETASDALQMAIQTAKDKFNIDKREIENESAAQIRNSQTRIDARKSSIGSSLKVLKQSFPDLDKNSEKQMKAILESGDINSLFMNRDGSFKPESAEMLMMALHGKETLAHLMKVSAKRAESKINEDILSRAADKPKPNKGGNSPKDVDEKTMKAINALTGGLNKGKTY